ncbi:MAG TPA: NUMOD3 domain-containing DNA-binding protein [Terracidiphilus sp.]|nr:NUMOD3 domain-containing DNA-binding protein [Terracidiphilus sp.]
MRHVSQQTKLKLSLAHKALHKDLNGERNPFFGKHHSAETIAKMSGPNNHGWKGGVLKRVHVPCAACGADLLRSTTRAKRNCFCNATHMLRYRYDNNLVDRNAIVANAHKAMEAIHWRRGMPNPAVAGENSPAKRPEARAKIRAAKLERNWMRGRTGKLHHNWQGGKIWWRGKEWDEIKLSIRQRDGFMCAECDMTEWQHIQTWGHPLHVHHIIAYRISHDNSPLNLITLCDSCHGKKKREENALIEQVRPLLVVA